MNPFYNPLFISRILKTYLLDSCRIYKLNDETLRKFQNKKLKRIVKESYKVPFFNKKCKEMGVNPDHIKTVDDIKKLPITTKKDLLESKPENIVPKGFNFEYSILLNTAGSTGKSTGLYADYYRCFTILLEHITCLKNYDINWKKNRCVFISNMSELASLNTTNNIVRITDVFPALKHFFPLDNIVMIKSLDNIENLMKTLNDFKPDFILGYPNDLKLLSYQKNNGCGENINPKIIASTGYLLDEYKRKIIHDSFDAPVFDIYGSTEAGIMAFQCKNGKYHVLSDSTYLECLDNNNEDAESGKVVVTKFYCGGTPIIRYDGLGDKIMLSGEDCSCGIVGTEIKKIFGREVQSIKLPNGKVLYPYDIEYNMHKIIYEMHTNKITWFQMIQRKIDEIEILIVIDKDLIKEEPSLEKLFFKIKKSFQNLCGREVKIEIREVEERNDKPYIIPYVDGNNDLL